MFLVNLILGAGIINLIMGLVIVLSWRELKKSLPFAFFSFATFLLGLSDYFIYKLGSPIFDRFSYAAGALIPTFLLAWIYNNYSKNPKTLVNWFIYLVGIIFFTLSIWSDFIIYGIEKSSVAGLTESVGILFPVYLGFYLIAYGAVLIGLIRMMHSADEAQRKQTKPILIGFSIYGGSAILFGLILPFLGYDKWIDLDVVVSIFFVASTTYAIVQYKWMNIKVVAVQFLSLLIVSLAFTEIILAETFEQRIYKGTVFFVIAIISWLLVKSVMVEVYRKEQLQEMATRLAQANDQLRTLDNAKTEFISIASHQLRTPITAIKGFSSLLLEGSYGEVSESVHGALEKVYSSAERLVDLVEDLLNVSRIESGRMQFTFEKASVEKLIKELYDNFILIAKNKKLYLDIKLPENTLPEIVMDYSKIRELVSNFIDNALKYTEKGGATVKAELREEGVVIDENGFVIVGKKSEFGKVIRITVSDTGIGIPKEEIPYLFKKFSRGKDVSRLHVGGTGLGLYVGKAIAETHHGQVWVESDGAGKGSRFIIEIPVDSQKL